MEKPKEESKKFPWIWVLGLIIVLGTLGSVGWYEWEHRFDEHNCVAHLNSDASTGKINHTDGPAKTIPHTDLCPCEKKKLQKPKPPQKKQKSAPKQEVKPVQKAIAPAPVLSVIEVPTKVEPNKPILDGVDPDFGKIKMVFTPLPEKEEPPPKVGRKIYVVRQPSPPVQYYGGGYGYNYEGTPSVIYGGTPAFVPNPPVIVQAPSIVTQPGHPPAVITQPPSQVYYPSPPVYYPPPPVIVHPPSVTTQGGGYVNPPGVTTGPKGPGVI